jgi:tRNA nucleotidyltransferase (CCA-adding enzyme)
MDFKISDGAAKILDTLEKAGFSAYIVGGAVRDMIMGKQPHDFDIASSARPEQIQQLFPHTIDTGIKHGTVTVIENKTGFEVTTYRSDGAYNDSRHPDSVRFMPDIKDDLARRDFTVNAMAYSPSLGLVDLYGGQEDLRRGIIRCVGNAKERFREDALRMMRAVRFSAVLDFELDADIQTAIRELSGLICRVSVERIRDELNKILLSDRPEKFELLHELCLLQYIMPEAECCFGTPQKNKYHIYDVGRHTMAVVAAAPCDLTLRWAALMHDTGKPECLSRDASGIIHFYGHHRESMKITEDIMHRLRFDNETIRVVSSLVECHDVRVEASPAAVKRMLARIGGDLFEKLLLLQEADNRGKNPRYLEEKLKRIDEVREVYKTVIAEHQPYMLSELLVNGRDLIKLGYRAGREIGDTLHKLLEEVIINPSLNDREYLLRRARQLKKR